MWGRSRDRDAPGTTFSPERSRRLVTALLTPAVPRGSADTTMPGLADLRADYEPLWRIGPCLLLPEAERGVWLTAVTGRYTVHVEGAGRMRAEIEAHEAMRKDTW